MNVDDAFLKITWLYVLQDFLIMVFSNNCIWYFLLTLWLLIEQWWKSRRTKCHGIKNKVKTSFFSHLSYLLISSLKHTHNNMLSTNQHSYFKISCVIFDFKMHYDCLNTCKINLVGLENLTLILGLTMFSPDHCYSI